MSHLITLQADVANITEDAWQFVALPPSQQEVRKQAGKVVLFKLTGEQTVTPEQIAGTLIPANGKVLVPLSVFIARKTELQARLAANGIQRQENGTANTLRPARSGCMARHARILDRFKPSASGFKRLTHHCRARGTLC